MGSLRATVTAEFADIRVMTATLIAPDTAFTFEVLADCHLDFLTSKKSTYDYVRKLQRRTDNSCASGVTVRSMPSSVCIILAHSFSRAGPLP